MATLTISPEDEKRVKQLGFLSNKGTDNFSARVITVNGRITAEQMRILSEAAEQFGNGTVTFTTRLTVEVPGIPFEKIEEFCAYIEKAGLTTGGTGAKVRPVVSCKGTTCQYGLIDTFALSEEIHHRFYEGYRSVVLPHKFKIAVGGCPNNCVKPDLNDLGIIGQRIPNYNSETCRGCKKCAIEKSCPMHAAKLTDGVMNIDPALCNHCGRCIGKCPSAVSKTAPWATRFTSEDTGARRWEEEELCPAFLPLRRRRLISLRRPSFFIRKRENPVSGLHPLWNVSDLKRWRLGCTLA